MKFIKVAVAIAAVVVLVQPAYARQHHHRHYRHFSHREARSRHFARRYWSRMHSRQLSWKRYAGWSDDGYESRQQTRNRGEREAVWAARRRSARQGGYGGRPAAWCGWEMRHLVSSDPGGAYNLARNWAHWGHSGPAGVGAVVVWPHHVGRIVGRDNGQWVIESGNDGHRLRTRPRSIAGAIAVRWG